MTRIAQFMYGGDHGRGVLPRELRGRVEGRVSETNVRAVAAAVERRVVELRVGDGDTRAPRVLLPEECRRSMLRKTTDVSEATKPEDRLRPTNQSSDPSSEEVAEMLRFVAVGIAGVALGATATAGAVGGFRIIQLHPNDITPVAGTHIFCHVRSESAVSPYTGPAGECGETKAGVPGSFGVGITDEAVYVGRWDFDVKRLTRVVYVRHHRH